MSSIYFRVPHYVAAYVRNRDPRNRVQQGELLKKSHIENVLHIIKNGLFFNGDERVMHNGCFSERQWNRMMRGYCIYGLSQSKPLLQPKTDSSSLTDAEVRMLSGLDYSVSGSDGEYLRMPIPEEILLPDGIHRTSKSYQLRNSAAEELRSRLLHDFKRAMFDFFSREKDMVQAEGISRTFIDSLERFMACYDIRNGVDNKERSALKRAYYRWRADKMINPEDYVNHA